MDKIKLRDYRQKNATRLFMIGGKVSEDMYPKKKEIRLAMAGRPFEFVYEGPVSRAKPFQVKLWIEQAPKEDNYTGHGYMDYFNPTSRFGLDVMQSFESACKFYEKEFGYYPQQILLVRV
ncbi:hypothetical protein ABID22_000114 [Pontibacter aydingkolensis]|uniref:Uncharacterized protein n=1 Tax=Pontibacter aydingkolensis TaxID=1911536 RepID=A0ABS7CQV0_9BACT|nr:hypothetical protein [Pontibacter aydingkolensis]MBW7466218.1 hypothetical protein [Pontibacter aydingkolensis]